MTTGQTLAVGAIAGVIIGQLILMNCNLHDIHKDLKAVQLKQEATT